jgi:hypothetical protein
MTSQYWNITTGCPGASMNGPCTLSDEQVQFAGMRSSHLVLKADGTYEQHHQTREQADPPEAAAQPESRRTRRHYVCVLVCCNWYSVT